VIEARDRNESVDVALFLLAVAPHSRHCLLIIGRVPVRVKHDKPIGSDQIQATPTSLATQHEDVVCALAQTYSNVYDDWTRALENSLV